MDKYSVKLLPKAYEDIDKIYRYISEILMESKAAESNVNCIEEAIIGLENFPYRGAKRKVGVYANGGYRQLFAKNFTVIYKVNEKMKCVIVVTVKYSPSCF